MIFEELLSKLTALAQAQFMAIICGFLFYASIAGIIIAVKSLRDMATKP